MKQYDFSKEEMNFMIDKLKDICSNSTMIKEKFFSAEHICLHNTCIPGRSCVECTEIKFKAFLDIVKKVFVYDTPPIQITSQEQKEKGLHKYRLFSVYGETLDWIKITDEQLRLMKYLQSNDLLGDEVEFEECEAPNFKKI